MATMPLPEPAPVDSAAGDAADPDLAAPAGDEPAKVGRTALSAAEAPPSGPFSSDRFPIQSAKVQEPPLRDETLPRERLLDWLRSKINHRVILVTAEAGYGKTTLVADFSRRSRHRTLWYRLDEGDQSWSGFLAYLIAAGREFLPGFASVTASLLAELGPNGPTREHVVDAFLREFGVLGDRQTVLVIDDVHLVDRGDDVGYVLRHLVERLPSRMTLVLISRRPPAVHLGRLRGQGEVAELTGADLRFDDQEIDRLFRESYQQPLEPDLLREVARRTEGWVASLELVRTALRDRPVSEAREFVAELSGSRGDVYDYLAEEVVGDLSSDLQRFLMRASILERLDEDLVGLTTDLDQPTVRRRLEEAEQLGLLARRPRGRGAHRFHPLVREFLDTRLRAEIGPDAVAELHRTVARAVERRDWATACRHYTASGDEAEIARVIETSIGLIMASGDYAQAEAIIDGLTLEPVPPSFHIIRSRMELRRGTTVAAVEHARKATMQSPTDAARANLVSILLTSGRMDDAHQQALEAAEAIVDDYLRDIARISHLVIRGSLDAPLADLAAEMARMAEVHTRSGHRQFAGVANLNLAQDLLAAGELDASLTAAGKAIGALEGSDNDVELCSAYLAQASTLAHLGELEQARRACELAVERARGRFVAEVAFSAAMIEVMHGDIDRADQWIASIRGDLDDDPDFDEGVRMARIRILLRRRDLETAEAECTRLRFGRLSGHVAAEAQRYSLLALHRVLSDDPAATEAIESALAHAARQGAGLWLDFLALLRSAVAGTEQFETSVRAALERDPGLLRLAAEVVIPRLDALRAPTFEAFAQDVQSQPERWRDAIRRELDAAPYRRSVRVAQLLEHVGTQEDVIRLRRFSRAIQAKGSSGFGLALARRLAERVFVEDQGRVVVHVGARTLPGAKVRRKVLALLCFLISRTDLSAARDEVLEALWPDLEPMVALNSLNQTIYFLRRVLEPDYKEELSPGYVHHESDVVWLDGELISSRSRRCQLLLQDATRSREASVVDELVETYRGRFALDFAYEDWAAAYRDTMHASYLQVMEREISDDIESGDYEHGIHLARRAIEVDPDAEELEVALLRLYRSIGAAAAAAEQYAHYSAMLRTGLGLEPAPLDEL
jgi:DNA-binding SARP family transcriptional activator/tetratricopeptide (TPR) repeat protein